MLLVANLSFPWNIINAYIFFQIFFLERLGIYYLELKKSKDLHRVFIDTNIVWNLHSFSEEIYDNCHFDEGMVLSKIGKMGLQDLEALRELIQVIGRYGSIEFVTAKSALSELRERRIIIKD